VQTAKMEALSTLYLPTTSLSTPDEGARCADVASLMEGFQPSPIPPVGVQICAPEDLWVLNPTKLPLAATTGVAPGAICTKLSMNAPYPLVDTFEVHVCTTRSIPDLLHRAATKVVKMKSTLVTDSTGQDHLLLDRAIRSGRSENGNPYTRWCNPEYTRPLSAFAEDLCCAEFSLRCENGAAERIAGALADYEA